MKAEQSRPRSGNPPENGHEWRIRLDGGLSRADAGRTGAALAAPGSGLLAAASRPQFGVSESIRLSAGVEPGPGRLGTGCRWTDSARHGLSGCVRGFFRHPAAGGHNSGNPPFSTASVPRGPSSGRAVPAAAAVDPGHDGNGLRRRPDSHAGGDGTDVADADCAGRGAVAATRGQRSQPQTFCDGSVRLRAAVLRLQPDLRGSRLHRAARAGGAPAFH